MPDTNYTPSCSNNQNRSNECNNKNCDMVNGSSSGGSSSNSNSNSKEQLVNGFDLPNGSGSAGQGSPSRSQLGLKLKSHTPATRKQSPLQVCTHNFQTLFKYTL